MMSEEIRTMMSDNYKLSFDYYLEYAVVERRDYLCDERVFASRDVHEAFRERCARLYGVWSELEGVPEKPGAGEREWYGLLRYIAWLEDVNLEDWAKSQSVTDSCK